MEQLVFQPLGLEQHLADVECPPLSDQAVLSSGKRRYSRGTESVNQTPFSEQ